MFYVYQLRLTDSETPFYIGKGRGRRKNFHLTPSALKTHSHKNHVINKAMRDGVEVLVEILHENLTEPEAHAKEVELIAFYGRRINGGCLTNATDGGEGASGRKHTDAAKRKIAESKRGIPRTPETRAKLSVAASNPTSATREKMSNSHSGVPLKSSHASAIRFSHWDKDASWLNAGNLYDDWVNSGKPGWRKARKIFEKTYVEKIFRNFSSGWIPASDPLWIEYVTKRLG